MVIVLMLGAAPIVRAIVTSSKRPRLLVATRKAVLNPIILLVESIRSIKVMVVAL